MDLRWWKVGRRIVIEGKPFDVELVIPPEVSKCFEDGSVDIECLDEMIDVKIVPADTRMALEIEVRNVGGRCKAFAYIDGGSTRRLLGSWWIESAGGKRYKPLKPMPPLVQAIISRLPRQEVERIAMFLLTAQPGEKLVVRIEKGSLAGREPATL